MPPTPEVPTTPDVAPKADGIPVPIGNGKTVVVGGSVVGILFAAATFFYNAHTEAMGKIAALDAKVTALQNSMAEWKQVTNEQRQEMRAEIKELNQAVTGLARSLKISGIPSGAGAGIPLAFGAPECPGDEPL